MSTVTTTDSTPAATFPATVTRLAELYGDREAVVAPEGRVTFSELARRCDEIAGAFAAAGLRHGERVGILLPNGLRWLVAVLGAQRAGLVAVPINTWYRSSEMAHLIGTAELRMIVTDEHVFGKDILAELSAAGHGEIFNPGRSADGYRGALFWPAAQPFPPTAVRGPVPAPTVVSAEDVAMILFTSGSTALRFWA